MHSRILHYGGGEIHIYTPLLAVDAPKGGVFFFKKKKKKKRKKGNIKGIDSKHDYMTL